MTAIELMKKVIEKNNEIKKDLTKSYFSGDKSYFNEMFSKYPNSKINNNIYETISNIASLHARSLEY